MPTANFPPAGLKIWFVAHFAVDMLFAIPLFLAPRSALLLARYDSVIDPLAMRLVGGALLAIGLTSWLCRNAGIEAYRGLLVLKVFWSVAGTVALALSILGRLQVVTAIAFFVFLIFATVWVYYLRKINPAPSKTL